ncbi:MAG: lamin tail domain-containing protein [Sedimentisphaerales bacterium]|nr:lamin tail domain-containing protein [Sedimentisphaerales bacterium]
MLAAVCVAASRCPGAVALVINELAASNGSIIRDPQGEFEDWIELHNFGGASVDIAGMYLTDDLSNPTKYQIPPGNPSLTTIQAGGYILVWADGETDDAGLHADFKLDADGEEIGLFDIDGQTLVDGVVFDVQARDVSFGRYPDAGETWGYALSATPGGPNAGLYEGIVSDVRLSHDRGFYDTPFELVLSCDTPEAVIYYTLDSREPGDTGGRTITGRRYTAPIPITRTACVRVRAIRPGWGNSAVRTCTYIFPGDVVLQSTISGVVPEDRLATRQLRDALLAIPTVSLVTPYLISEQEREASIELLFPDGRPGFQADAGIEHFGGHSLQNYPKKSMRVSFKGLYGPARLTFDLFGDGATDTFDQILLRSGSHDTMFYTNGTRGIYIRNRWILDRQLDMGQPAPHGRFVHLYINGTYWGQYHLMERPNAAFMASYFGGEKEEYDALNAGSPVDGTRQAWDEMTRATGDYQELTRYMDVTNYADFMLLQFYGGNDWDWRSYQNWMAARKREEGAGFKFFCWDSDMVLRRGLNANVVNLGGPGDMWNSVKQHEEFRMLLADRAQKHFFNDGTLTRDRVLAQFEELAGQIEASIVAETARWGQSQGYTPATWRENLGTVRSDIVAQRTEIVIDQMRSAGVFPLIDAPAFHVNGQPQHGGHIDGADHLSMTASVGQIYYTLDGADPRLPGTPEPQSTASMVAEDAPRKVLVPTGPVDAGWNSDPFDDAGWLDATGGLGYERGSGYEPFITLDLGQQMYDQQTTCYVRIPFTLTAAQVREARRLILAIRYDDGFIAYLNGVEVARALVAGVPAWDSAASGSHEAGLPELFDISEHSGRLRRGPNLLAIQGLNSAATSSDFVITAELQTSAGPPFFESGISPEAVTYVGPLILDGSATVRARTLDNGQWSALSEAVFAVGPVAEFLRISEIMYHPKDSGELTDPDTEYIELTNVGNAVVNLNLVRFTEGVDFTFPRFELGPDEYVLVVKDRDALEARYGPGLPIAGEYSGSLSNSGEWISLQDAAGRTIQAFSYQDSWHKTTDGKGFSLTATNPGDTDLDNWSDKTAWRPSTAAWGSPGRDEVAKPGT